MTIVLRDYQNDCVDALFAYFERASGNPLCVIPTGGGKSLTMASFVKRAIEEHPDTSVLIATHRRELISQDAAALTSVGVPCGIYSAGLGMRQLRQVTVGGVQSLHGKKLRPFSLLMIDEAHCCPQSDTGMYRDLIRSMKNENADLKVIGWTATSYRLSGGQLTRGTDKIFSSICYEIGVQRLVDDGYLAPLVSPTVVNGVIDTSQAKLRGGEFITGELAGLADNEVLISEALNEFEALAADRKSCLFFCVSVEHAENVVRALRMRGHTSEIVVGDTADSDRSRRIEAFKAGQIRCLVSVDVLSVGFDAPRTDCIVMLRPTMSTGLYYQQAGRGMRLFPGKKNALILDFAGSIERHGPITALRPRSTGPTEAKGVKECPTCMAELPVWKKECPECGYIFEGIPRVIEHDKQASRAAIMAAQAPEPPVRVVATRYSMHEKEGKPPSMRVEYLGNVKTIASEWVCIEHGGYASQKAMKWWSQHGGQMPYPSTVNEALDRSGELREVSTVTLSMDGNFTRVDACTFADMREPGCDDDAGDSGSSEDPSLTPYPADDPVWDDSDLPF